MQKLLHKISRQLKGDLGKESQGKEKTKNRKHAFTQEGKIDAVGNDSHSVFVNTIND